jgi:hypothetical protein
VFAEASPRDRIWGIGLAAGDPRAGDPARWRGLNLLGRAVSEARAALEPRSALEPRPAPGPPVPALTDEELEDVLAAFGLA